MRIRSNLTGLTSLFIFTLNFSFLTNNVFAFEPGSNSRQKIILVRLNISIVSEGELSPGAVEQQRRVINELGSKVLDQIAGTGAKLIRRYETVPVIALEPTEAAIDILSRSNYVSGFREERLLSPSLKESIPIVEADQASIEGYNGSGYVVAVIDTGIQKSHKFISAKVVDEACFSSSGNCPNGGTTEVGTGAGENCDYAFACIHGTHVAGIVAGNWVSASRGPGFSGVAKSAGLMSIQVGSTEWDAEYCLLSLQWQLPCLTIHENDMIAALEYVYKKKKNFKIAAVNMSIGDSLSHKSYCDIDPYLAYQKIDIAKIPIDNLKDASIPTIVATGNEEYPDGINWPACISSAVSVGATTNDDKVAYFSNSASFISLLAPGVGINSAFAGGVCATLGGCNETDPGSPDYDWTSAGYQELDGTSMAAPHVAGAWAILKAAKPGASVDYILDALQSTGLKVIDEKNGISKKRIRIEKALDAILP